MSLPWSHPGSSVIRYFSRSSPSASTRTRQKIPLLGGTLTISIVEAHDPPQVGGGPLRFPKARFVAKLQRISTLGNNRPSDEVEGLKFDIQWEPVQGVLGVNLPPEALVLPQGVLELVSSCIKLCRTAILIYIPRILMTLILRGFYDRSSISMQGGF